MTKIVKSKSKAIPSSRKKLTKKAIKAKRAAPKSAKRSKQRNSAETRGSKQQNSAETRGSKQHQPTVRLPLAESTRVAGAEGVTRRFPRPFLFPFAMMDMWFRAVEPKRDGK